MDFRTEKELEYKRNGNIQKVKASGIIFDYNMEKDDNGNVIKVTAIGSIPRINFQQAAGYPAACSLMRNGNINMNIDSNLLPHVIKGVAVLKDNDISDVKTAKKIAKLKALRQYYKIYSNFVRFYLNQLAKEVEKGDIFWDDIEEKLADCDHQIIELTRGENDD